MTAGVWRWATPDPERETMMVGHYLATDEGGILLDPPVVPGLVEWLQVLGGVRAIILTTHDHTRGAAWIRDRLGVPVYVPVQADAERLRWGGIQKAHPYADGESLPGGLDARRMRVMIPGGGGAVPYLDEMLLLWNGDTVAVVGDVVSGSPEGQLLGCPTEFAVTPDPVKVQASLDAFQATVPASVTTLLIPHGQDLVGTLPAARTFLNP